LGGVKESTTEYPENTEGDKMQKLDLSVKIGPLTMKNPVTVASGTFGYGPEYAELVDLNRLGAITVKGIREEAGVGNCTPRTFETASGLLNAIGLPGPGVEGFIREYLPFLAQFDTPVIVNIWGKTAEEYGRVARRLDAEPGVAALEVNVSCPNVKEGGSAFGTDVAGLSRVVEIVRAATSKAVIVKLAPNVPSVAPFARAAKECGADGLAVTNTLPAMAINIETRRPELANRIGGLSGPAIKPVAVKLVYDAWQASGLPIIGMGGIGSAADAVEFMLAGAAAVAVGTANFTDPSTALRVIEGIEAYLVRQGIGAARELTGGVLVE